MKLRFLSYQKNYIALSIVTAFTLVLLTVGRASADSSPRWPESPKRGYCSNPTAQDQCYYPASRNGQVYSLWNLDPRPTVNPVRIGGFYVDLKTPNSRARVNWEGSMCNSPNYTKRSGFLDISYSSTGKNYIGFGEGSTSICSFSFTLSNISPLSISFETNFDVAY